MPCLVGDFFVAEVVEMDGAVAVEESVKGQMGENQAGH